MGSPTFYDKLFVGLHSTGAIQTVKEVQAELIELLKFPRSNMLQIELQNLLEIYSTGLKMMQTYDPSQEAELISFLEGIGVVYEKYNTVPFEYKDSIMQNLLTIRSPR